MNKRKSISKRLRFEVFKRDSFKCQWCGKSPDQDKVLQVDHIDPVSKGGTNEITNLITSCKDCNSGKSNIRINDNTVVLKQRRQLEHLQEKREQIELMFEWKNQLLNLKEDTVEEIIVYLEKNIPNFSINEKGRSSIKKYTDKLNASLIVSGNEKFDLRVN